MRAIVQRALGAPEVLAVEEIPAPRPSAGQVVIKVSAAGVHAVDTDIRRGEAPASMPRPALPMTPGREVAGIVHEVGPGVDAALLHARVVAHVGFLNGGYAEFSLAPAEALHRIPERVSFPQAVAAIGTGRTAQLILDAAPITESDVVIIPGASGGLGSQLTQLALSQGATAVALHGGAAKRAVVQGLASPPSRRGLPPGRLIVLDSTDAGWPERLADALEGVQPSMLIDGVGGSVGRAALEALGRGARAVIIGWSSGAAVRFDTDDVLRASLTVTVPLGRPVARLRALETRALAAVDDGRTDPPIDAYPLERAAQAHAAIEQRRQRGKIVLVP